MAKPVTLKFQEAVLMMGDGATVEDFDAVCGIENVTVTYNIETESEDIPDCDNPDDMITWLEDNVLTKQLVISGDAFLTPAIDEYFTDWVLDDTDESRNARVVFNWNVTGKKYYLGVPTKLVSYENSGERRQRWRAAFTLNGQGKPSKVTLPD